MYVALHATTNDAIASGKWTRKDDALAINQATTNINGGLINTRRIVLTADGTGNFLSTANAGSSGTRIEIGHDGIRGYGSQGGAGTEQFRIDPADGKAKFGGLTNAILSSEGIQLGDATFADAPFSVTPAGVIKAESGTIGGWSIDSNYIWSGTKKTSDGYSAGGTTLYNDGSLRSENFYIDGGTGSANFKGTLDVGGTSGDNLKIANTGITGYRSGSAKFDLKSSGAALTAYGAGGGGSGATGADAAALVLQNTSNYISYISAGSGDSDTRYDARYHQFRNFGSDDGDTGKIRGLNALHFDETDYLNIIEAENDIEIRTAATDETIDLEVGGVDTLYLSSSSIIASEHIIPSSSVYDLGTSGNKWGEVWAVDGSINTSDRRLKTEIQPTSLGLDFINDLKPISYRWIDNRGKAPRTHYGIIAQDVLETLEKHGITDRADFAGIVGNDEEYYGARYTEFVAILIKAVQELASRIEKLEEK